MMSRDTDLTGKPAESSHLKSTDAIPSDGYEFATTNQRSNTMSNSENQSGARRERLDFLMRKREGAARREELSNLLTHNNVSPDCLKALDESDDLRQAIKEAARTARRQDELTAATADDHHEIVRLSQAAINEDLSNNTCLVLFTDSDQIGVLEIDPNRLVEAVGQLLEFDEDSLIVTNHGADAGFISQRFECHNSISYQIERWSY